VKILAVNKSMSIKKQSNIWANVELSYKHALKDVDSVFMKKILSSILKINAVRHVQFVRIVKRRYIQIVEESHMIA
jgi:hypothetical protein